MTTDERGQFSKKTLERSMYRPAATHSSLFTRRRATGDERLARWTLLSMVAGMGAATIGLAPSSHANPFSAQFQSPSGDISCNLVNSPPQDTHSLGKNFVQCDIVNPSWVPPRPPPQGRDDATSTLVLMRGQLPIVGYSPGTLAASDPVNYDQPLSAGAIICTAAEQSAVKCTDTSTGHFFRVWHESYELG